MQMQVNLEIWLQYVQTATLIASVFLVEKARTSSKTDGMA